MSALVGYDSSSDEEDAAGNGALQTAIENAAASYSAPTAEKEAVNEPSLQDAPVVGPAAPTNGLDLTEQSNESPLPESQTMSERDTIRYLTQASHPMTSMPPSPPGSPDPTANARFRRFLELKSKGIHFNEDLASKTTFKNPSLLSSMLARAGIEEGEQYNTSLPVELWDPMAFPASAYKEQLLKSQQELREKDEASKKSLSASGKRTIEFASAGKSGPSSRHSTPGQSIKRKKP